MNDEHLGKEIGAFYRETDVTPPDSHESARQVAARLRRTPQVKRRRWLPAWPLRATHPPDTDQTTERQPSPIPATNGHAPTIIGRTQSMFSPIKAITTGALVFALGGMFLIAQPFDQGGSVPGAEQGADPVAPVEVTATYRGVACEGYDHSELEGRVVRVYGYTCTVDLEWSDSRLQGTDVYHENYVDVVDSGLTIGHYVHDIVTDDGAWRMRPLFRFESPGLKDFSGILVLDGEDDYEGLSVVLSKEGDDLTGFIISTDLLLPPPEEGSTK